MNMEPEQIPKELFQPARPQQQPVLPRSVGGRRAAAWGRFRKNGSSVVAVVVLALLLAFALIVPMVMPYGVEFRDGYYKNALPKWEALAFLGWDGCQEVTVNQATYDYYTAMGAVKQVKEKNVNATTGRYTYRVLVDAYAKVGCVYMDLTEAEYAALRDYERESGRQVCYPIPRLYQTAFLAVPGSANLWYQLEDESAASTGASAHHNADGEPIFVEDYWVDGDGQPVYAVKNQTGVRCRVQYAAYYQYVHGFAPRYLFGTNQYGQDQLHVPPLLPDRRQRQQLNQKKANGGDDQKGQQHQAHSLGNIAQHPAISHKNLLQRPFFLYSSTAAIGPLA